MPDDESSDSDDAQTSHVGGDHVVQTSIDAGLVLQNSLASGRQAEASTPNANGGSQNELGQTVGLDVSMVKRKKKKRKKDKKDNDAVPAAKLNRLANLYAAAVAAQEAQKTVVAQLDASGIAAAADLGEIVDTVGSNGSTTVPDLYECGPTNVSDNLNHHPDGAAYATEPDISTGDVDAGADAIRIRYHMQDPNALQVGGGERENSDISAVAYSVDAVPEHARTKKRRKRGKKDKDDKNSDRANRLGSLYAASLTDQAIPLQENVPVIGENVFMMATREDGYGDVAGMTACSAVPKDSRVVNSEVEGGDGIDASCVTQECVVTHEREVGPHTSQSEGCRHVEGGTQIAPAAVARRYPRDTHADDGYGDIPGMASGSAVLAGNHALPSEVEDPGGDSIDAFCMTQECVVTPERDVGGLGCSGEGGMRTSPAAFTRSCPLDADGNGSLVGDQPAGKVKRKRKKEKKDKDAASLDKVSGPASLCAAAVVAQSAQQPVNRQDKGVAASCHDDGYGDHAEDNVAGAEPEKAHGVFTHVCNTSAAGSQAPTRVQDQAIERSDNDPRVFTDVSLSVAKDRSSPADGDALLPADQKEDVRLGAAEAVVSTTRLPSPIDTGCLASASPVVHQPAEEGVPLGAAEAAMRTTRLPSSVDTSSLASASPVVPQPAKEDSRANLEVDGPGGALSLRFVESVEKNSPDVVVEPNGLQELADAEKVQSQKEVVVEPSELDKLANAETAQPQDDAASSPELSHGELPPLPSPDFRSNGNSDPQAKPLLKLVDMSGVFEVDESDDDQGAAVDTVVTMVESDDDPSPRLDDGAALLDALTEATSSVPLIEVLRPVVDDTPVPLDPLVPVMTPEGNASMLDDYSGGAASATEDMSNPQALAGNASMFDDYKGNASMLDDVGDANGGESPVTPPNDDEDADAARTPNLFARTPPSSGVACSRIGPFGGAASTAAAFMVLPAHPPFGHLPVPPMVPMLSSPAGHSAPSGRGRVVPPPLRPPRPPPPPAPPPPPPPPPRWASGTPGSLPTPLEPPVNEEIALEIVSDDDVGEPSAEAPTSSPPPRSPLRVSDPTAAAAAPAPVDPAPEALPTTSGGADAGVDALADGGVGAEGGAIDEGGAMEAESVLSILESLLPSPAAEEPPGW